MKTILWLAAIALMFVTLTAQAQGIEGTKHDLSATGADPLLGAGAGIDNGEICVYCHTPHNGLAAAPLWNKQYTGGGFDLYDSTTVEQTVAQPGPQSLACLSCHDGTVGVDEMFNAPGIDTNPTLRDHQGVNIFVATDPGYVGTNLADDHPIGVSYSQAIIDDGATAFQATPTYSKLYGASDLVECASCHEVHNDSNLGQFLRVSNAGSDLCYDCHIK